MTQSSQTMPGWLAGAGGGGGEDGSGAGVGRVKHALRLIADANNSTDFLIAILLFRASYLDCAADYRPHDLLSAPVYQRGGDHGLHLASY